MVFYNGNHQMTFSLASQWPVSMGQKSTGLKRVGEEIDPPTQSIFKKAGHNGMDKQKQHLIVKICL